MIYRLDDINRRLKENRDGFIRECEDEYRRKVSETADVIIANIHRSPVVLLGGPSGSGKTTMSFKLCEELSRRGMTARAISLDNYLKTVDDSYPRTETGAFDFESPDCTDIALLSEHIELLRNGKTIQVPRYDFDRCRRDPERHEDVRADNNGVLIFEGIHALNEGLTGEHPEALGLFVCVKSQIDCGELGVFESSWVRLARRTVRDKRERGADAAYTLFLWENVIAGERKYIAPFRGRAAVEIDSFLPYEVNALRESVEPLLKAVAEGGSLEKVRLSMIRALRGMEPIGSGDVPMDSLVREFIGNGVYSY